MGGNLGDMTWSEYVRGVIASDQQVDAARKAGVDQTTISRWVRGGQAGRAENVVKFARAYGRPVLEALVVAGFLTADEAHAQVTITRTQDPSDDELLEYLRRRLAHDRQERDPRGDTAPMTDVERTYLTLVRELGDDVTLGHLRASVDLAHPGAGVDVPGRTDVPHEVDELAHRRRAEIAERIATGDMPAAARTDDSD